MIFLGVVSGVINFIFIFIMILRILGFFWREVDGRERNYISVGLVKVAIFSLS